MSNLKLDFEQQIGKYCIFIDPGGFQTAVHISLKNKYLYVSTPKVACSTVKSTLHRIELEDPDYYRADINHVHNKEFSPLLFPSQIGSVDEFLNRKNILKFCFVRNPYTRILSAYLEKIAKNKAQKRRVLMYLGKDFTNKKQHITFLEFIKVVCEQHVLDMNPHWKVQYYQTMQDSIAYNIIGRFESFESDFKKILNEFCIDSERYLHSEQSHSSDTNKLLSDYYCDESVHMVMKKFAIDFSYFGYSTDFDKA